jgi:hypothetical protein
MPKIDYKEKVYAFIDSNNLNLAIKSCGWKFRKYMDFINYLEKKIGKRQK